MARVPTWRAWSCNGFAQCIDILHTVIMFAASCSGFADTAWPIFHISGLCSLPLQTLMSPTPVRRPPPSPYEKSSLSRLPVEVSRFLVSKNLSIVYVFICSAKAAYLRDPTVRAIRALSIRLQVPLRGVQTIPTLLSRSLHPRETRSSYSRKSKSERIHYRTLVPDMHPGDC